MAPRPDIIPVESLDDPRIAPYRNLTDRELARDGRRFIAEGELVVRRLLESALIVESVLLADRHVERLAPAAPRGVPVYAAGADVVDRIVGFEFHSGVMACGVRPPLASLEELATRWTARATVVVLPDVTKTDNLGVLLRTCAAFGVDAVLLGERCCDPFYRQSVRVSMGAVFAMNIVRSADLCADLRRLRDRWGFEPVAAVLDADAQPLPHAGRPDRLAIVLGNEATGVPPQCLALCPRRLTIPMSAGVDSLNVATAAGVMLYHFTMAANTDRP